MSCIRRVAWVAQVLALAGMMSASMAAPKPASAPGTLRSYVVLMKDAPIASYRGGVAGLAATQVPQGQRLDARSAAVQAYRTHLAGGRNQLLASLGGRVKVLHHYDFVVNGFSALLTDAQVNKLRASGQVLSVLADERREATTVSTPTFLELDTKGGVWSKKVKGTRLNGEGVIIAVIDSGIQPESPAFYDRVDDNGTPVKTGGTLAYQPLPAGRYTGTCTSGPGFTADACNNKLVGAQVFSAGYQAVAAVGGVNAYYDFYEVPRDNVGHGTHTLSTAGGNDEAAAVTSGGIYIGTTSGVAPRARVASYKALFATINNGYLGGTGFNSDLVAAIDKAVADGVDVINYSISGSQTNLMDPVEVAFRNASAAGVFVAASAGNSGPGNQVAHPSPWITTVAASTHGRSMKADLTLGNGSTFAGASFAPNVLPSAPMVLSSDIGAAGVSVSDANLCFANTLDPTKAAGKIVVCDRGVNDRVAKSAEVLRVGGVGMVLINPTSNNTVADFHSVPSVHLDSPVRSAVRDYVSSSGTGARGSISQRYQAPGAIAPVMASFSSRGPNMAELSVMKPEITAPGVDVIASVSQNATSQAELDAMKAGTRVPTARVESYQGTSMSSPHVAGVAALIKQAHPSWTPAEIKSAMLTTATSVLLADGTTDTDGNGYGAGHVNPLRAIDPGLVYSADAADYIKFLCGANWLSPESSDCAGGEIEPGNLNLPTIATDVPGKVVIKRRVRNVGKTAAVYSASATVTGFTAVVSPSTLSLEKGQVGDFTLTLTSAGAALDTGVYGSLTWQDGLHTVTSPVLARARQFSAPGLVSSGEASGKVKFKVGYGFTGPTSALATGLKAATRDAGSVALNAESCFSVSVPADALVIRAALYDTETSGNGGDDLDLTLYNPSGVAVAYSGGSTSNEVVSVNAPAAGTYRACVYGYAPVGGTSNFTLSSWVLSPSDAGGSLKISGVPTSVTVGDSATVKAKWTGLSSLRYLGGIRFMTGEGKAVGTTLLSVEPSAPSQTLGAGELSPAKVKRAARR
jgi:subtilisin family serine protease